MDEQSESDEQARADENPELDVRNPASQHAVVSEQSEWNERYAESDRIWSGQPNGALIAELSDMQPGRVLDIGCGEGSDAIWLATCGWQVTALDVSTLAVERAKAHAHEAGVSVDFLSIGLLDANLDPGSFDLVSAQYPALRHIPERDTEGLLVDLVASGGTLLFVHHVMDADHAKHNDGGEQHGQGTDDAGGRRGHDPGDQNDHGEGQSHDHAPGFDPTDYVSVSDMRARLEEGWIVEVDEERDRTITGGGGAHHVLDEVLRARRV